MTMTALVREAVRKHETILVVDDEIWLRQIAVRALRGRGYVVLDACDGQSALLVSESHDGPIDLVLCDAVMPGMKAAEIVVGLRRARPAMRVVFMSGYRGDELVNWGIDASGVMFVQKPFSAAELLHSVREELDRAEPAASTDSTDSASAEHGPFRGLRDRARLAVLHATQLLDTGRDERFDRLTRLAARFLGVPTVLFTLLDEHRDFYKSLHGIGDALLPRRELTGRTLCQHILHSSEPLVIADALADERYATLPNVVAFGVRAYLGIPLVVEAQTIGVLCVIDSVPREWTTGEVQTLVDLAALTVDEMELRVATRRIGDARAALSRTNAQLHLAKNAAETASLAKSVFLAHMSHELRTPLNSIIGFANVLQRNPATSLSERELTYVSRISSNGAKLLDVVDGILKLSTVEQGELNLRCTWVQVDDVARSVCSELAHDATAAGVSLVVEVAEAAAGAAPAAIHTDESRLRQILVNLVGNALRFTPAGGRVRVAVARDAQSGKPGRIDVADTGIGIAPEAQARVFEAFEQAEGDTGARFGGAGLGLRIARALCESLGFLLTLESVPGEGSTFTVDLSRAQPGNMTTGTEVP
jgi:signal transduction histidine kinase/DNA-binding response OmpR family regulator